MFLRQGTSRAWGGADRRPGVEPRSEILPLREAARRYLEIMSATPTVPGPEEVNAVARDLSRRLPLLRLPNGGTATTRAALESHIALKRYTRGF